MGQSRRVMSIGGTGVRTVMMLEEAAASVHSPCPGLLIQQSPLVRLDGRHSYFLFLSRWSLFSLVSMSECSGIRKSNPKSF